MLMLKALLETCIQEYFNITVWPINHRTQNRDHEAEIYGAIKMLFVFGEIKE